MSIKPQDDGIKHIRISPKGKTSLGRKLHISAYRPFIHDDYGYFASVIAFWSYLESNIDSLRDLHHANLIRISLTSLPNKSGNKNTITKAIEMSIDQNPAIKEALKENEFKFHTYEVLNQGGDHEKVCPVSRWKWYVKTIENIQQRLQNG